MGIITKLIKYGVVFAVGYYTGSGCSCAKIPEFSKLEQEVVKYEQKIDKNWYETRFFSKKS